MKTASPREEARPDSYTSGVVARAVHLVRHGEVHNPERVVYGRLPGFRLSDRGRAMAARTAEALREEPVARLIASPLLRAQQSAQPIAEAFGLPIRNDARVIESASRFEGRPANARGFLRSPRDAVLLLGNPVRPSWGEPFRAIAQRMSAAVLDAWRSTPDGHDVVVVSHQLPIWTAHRSAAGEPLAHDPRRRRCALSSVTSFQLDDGRLVETGYSDPAAELLAGAVDEGAA